MAKVLEVSRVAPCTVESQEYSDLLTSDSELSLPLTFCDIFWLKSSPVERLFFYSLSNPNPSFFHDSVLPRLKRSLSLTLRHFLPVAGNLTWPQAEPKPVLLYRANAGDAVSLVIAESDADFDAISGNQPHEAALLYPLVADLIADDDKTPVVSLKVTLFPRRGFCIGITNHHAALDGRSVATFIKAWAHLCREGLPLTPPLTPFFDRSVIADLKGLDLLYLKQWSESSGSGLSELRNSPNLWRGHPGYQALSGLVRTTCVLTRDDIARLRKKILSDTTSLGIRDDELRLSSFVVTYAYILVCIVKASEASGSKVIFGFIADFRSRMKPPVPENYFGNCIGTLLGREEMREIIAGAGASAVAVVAAMMSELVRSKLERENVMEGAEVWLAGLLSFDVESKGLPVRGIGVAGSPRFGLYGSDFGWGRPRKVEVTSIDKTAGIAMAESGDGSGGVEVGVVLVKEEMDIYSSLFREGLMSD